MSDCGIKIEIMCGLLDQVEGRMDIEVKFRRNINNMVNVNFEKETRKNENKNYLDK